MRYMLDTNICIYIAKNKPANVLQKFKSVVPGDVTVSSITYAELMFGVYKSQRVQSNLNKLIQFAEKIRIVPFDSAAADCYGRIRSQLECQGTPIGSLDTLIASHALSLDITLVTNNQREFSRVEKLKTENWSQY